MNIYCINLNQYFNLYRGLTIAKDIEKLKSLIKDQNNKIILSALSEVWEHEKILDTLEILGVTPNQDNVVLLLDVYSYSEPEYWTAVNIVLYDSLLCRVHRSEQPDFSNNIDNDKFLFMVGSPYKKQRIFPIYELYQRNRLANCEWSLHYKPHLEDMVRCYLPNISDDAYQKFITTTTKSIDAVSPIFGETNTVFQPIAFNPTAEIYANTAVSLVTETTFHPELYWFITEKTWKAINNFHPFVLIGYTKTYEYLESLGIDTFQYAVQHTYDKLVGPEEDVIKMCVDNVLYLLDNKSKYKEKLIDSTINNKKIFDNLASMYNNVVPRYLENIIWTHAFQKVKTDNAVEVYEKIWGKNGAVGED